MSKPMTNGQRCLFLWENGFDTKEIADKTDLNEGYVAYLIRIEREKEREALRNLNAKREVSHETRKRPTDPGTDRKDGGELPAAQNLAEGEQAIRHKKISP